MKNLKVPFGLHIPSGKIVDVHSVELGARCNCTCPACGANLIAKLNHKTPHFAHKSECLVNGGLETSIHKAAKQILAEEKQIWLPDYSYAIADPRLTQYWSEGIEVKFTNAIHVDSVRLEVPIGTIIPDAILEYKGREIAIEVEVFNPINETKRKEYAKRALSAIRIDLSKKPHALTLDQIRKIIQEADERKHWIYNNRISELIREARKRATEKQIVYHKSHKWPYPLPHVQNCPLKIRQHEASFFANVKLDCRRCKYATLVEIKRVRCAEDEANKAIQKFLVSDLIPAVAGTASFIFMSDP